MFHAQFIICEVFQSFYKLHSMSIYTNALFSNGLVKNEHLTVTYILYIRPSKIFTSWKMNLLLILAIVKWIYVGYCCDVGEFKILLNCSFLSLPLVIISHCNQTWMKCHSSNVLSPHTDENDQNKSLIMFSSHSLQRLINFTHRWKGRKWNQVEQNYGFSSDQKWLETMHGGNLVEVMSFNRYPTKQLVCWRSHQKHCMQIIFKKLTLQLGGFVHCSFPMQCMDRNGRNSLWIFFSQN